MMELTIIVGRLLSIETPNTLAANHAPHQIYPFAICTAPKLFYVCPVVERKLEDDSIPEFARSYACANYKFKKIDESRRIFLSDKVLILIILKGNRLYRSILFSNDGDLVADKSIVAGHLFSIFGASIIPDIGIFKPFKLNDRMVGPASFDYRNVGK